MFRCLAWRWQQLDCPEDDDALRNLGLQTRIKMASNQIWCNSTEVTELIRSEQVSALSSQISKFPVIRDIMKQKQRELVEDVRNSGSFSVQFWKAEILAPLFSQMRTLSFLSMLIQK